MAKRDRTSGIPSARRRERQAERPQRFYQREAFSRAILLGLPALLILGIVGLLGWRWYDDAYRRPDQVILQVGDHEATLGYLSDRLNSFARANPGSSATIEQALFRKIEEEELTILLAEQRGISLTDDEVTAHIAEALGVEPDTSKGSEFDRAYRNLLDTTGLSDGDYRRVARAELADARIREQLRADVPTTGDTISYRFFTTANEGAAADATARLQDGEDFDTVANEISPLAPESTATPTDDASADPTGEATATPEGDTATEEPDEPTDQRLVDSVLNRQLPEELQDAMASAQPGDVVGPVRIGGAYLVAVVTERNTGTTLTDEQIDLLVGDQFQVVLDEFRPTVNIERDFSTDDAGWARDNA